VSFSVSEVRYTYPGADRPAVADLSLDLTPGAHTVVIGPNGAGKTTFLRLLLGRLRPSHGRVTLDGRPCADWQRKAFARRVALVGQGEPGTIPYTVRELVSMGRYPRLRLLGGPSEMDREAVSMALARLDLLDLADRHTHSLSGGELQRARLARALAQEPEILLLDEPTAHLDVGHEMALFELVAQLSIEQRITIVSITHNVNLAGRFADDLVLLDGGRLAGHGTAREILTDTMLSAVYEWPMKVTELPGIGRTVLPLRGSDA
jgi:iron complex transport system ATP-binding protein